MRRAARKLRARVADGLDAAPACPASVHSTVVGTWMLRQVFTGCDHARHRLAASRAASGPRASLMSELRMGVGQCRCYGQSAGASDVTMLCAKGQRAPIAHQRQVRLPRPSSEREAADPPRSCHGSTDWPPRAMKGAATASRSMRLSRASAPATGRPAHPVEWATHEEGQPRIWQHDLLRGRAMRSLS